MTILVKTFIKPKVVGLDNLDRIFKRCKCWGKEPASYAGIKAGAENMVLTEVRKFFQSGNCIYQSPQSGSAQISKNLTSTILKSKGLNIPILVLSDGKVKRGIKKNPFFVRPLDLNKAHLHFLSDQGVGLSK